MSMICIGGVCVPYSAVVPLILLGFRWVFAKLYLYGLLPSFVAEMMNLNSVPRKEPPSTVSKPANTSNPSKRAIVKALESEDEFDDLLKRNEKFVVKFTATWCKPCKSIHPFYEEKCAEYNDYDFLTVDVDDFDTIAKKYSVAMMPTFIVVQGGSIIGTCLGSNEHELNVLLQTHLR